MFLYSTVSTLNPEKTLESVYYAPIYSPVMRNMHAHPTEPDNPKIPKAREERKWEKGGLTDCRDGGDNFTQLQLIEDGGLSCSVQTDHQNSHLLFTP